MSVCLCINTFRTQHTHTQSFSARSHHFFLLTIRSVYACAAVCLCVKNFIYSSIHIISCIVVAAAAAVVFIIVVAVASKPCLCALHFQIELDSDSCRVVRLYVRFSFQFNLFPPLISSVRVSERASERVFVDFPTSFFESLFFFYWLLISEVCAIVFWISLDLF